MTGRIPAVCVALVLLVSGVAGCGGGDSSSPTAPTPTPAPTSVTFSGTVTNIVTGVPVGGATVTIGSASATGSADGTYNLAVTASGQASVSVSASGYYTRESAVSMTGATTINPGIIPQGDGFELMFFDWAFRENGTQGTARRIATPTYEIWTRQFTCLELSTDGYSACVRMQALEAEVPPVFETLVRTSISKLGQLTGGVVTNAVITTKSHAPGTILRRNDWGTAPGVVSIEYQTTGLWVDANNNGGDACFCSNDLHESGPGHIVYGTKAGLSQSIHDHEVAHSVGFNHPGTRASTKPSIMGNAPAISSADELHGRILYRRPNGSLTPDRDPSGVTIN
jgi:hypothetical protein